MKTKALVLTVALGAAGVATSMAQVFSQNAVGYVNTPVPNGFSMIAAPFVVPSYTLNALLNPSTLPNNGIGVSFYKFLSGNFKISTVDPVLGGEWDDDQGAPNGNVETIDFGHGGFILNGTGAPFTITWVGEVQQGTPITTTIPLGFSVRSSKVPQTGKVQTDLAFPASPGDSIYLFNAGNFDIYTSDPVGTGQPGDWYFGATQLEPTLGVGQSMFVLKVDSNPWLRNFTVN